MMLKSGEKWLFLVWDQRVVSSNLTIPTQTFRSGFFS